MKIKIDLLRMVDYMEFSSSEIEIILISLREYRNKLRIEKGEQITKNMYSATRCEWYRKEIEKIDSLITGLELMRCDYE